MRAIPSPLGRFLPFLFSAVGILATNVAGADQAMTLVGDLDPPQCTDECFDVGCGVLTIPVGFCITRTETCKSTNRADDGCTHLLDRVANEDVQTDFACLASAE